MTGGFSDSNPYPGPGPEPESYSISGIIQMMADQNGIRVNVEGIDDTCNGLIISSDETLNSFLSRHGVIYDWTIRDGDPIRLIRRTDDEAVDFTIAQEECKTANGAPALTFRRIDPNTLPSRVEIQYMDSERQFVSSTQVASRPGVPTTNPQMGVSTAFVLNATAARTLATAILYRLWAQQIIVDFEHGDMRIEPGDLITLTADQGTFKLIVLQADLTPARTVQVSATIFFDQTSIEAETTDWDAGLVPNNDLDYSAWVVVGL